MNKQVIPENRMILSNLTLAKSNQSSGQITIIPELHGYLNTYDHFNDYSVMLVSTFTAEIREIRLIIPDGIFMR